jgi:DNA-binding PadR family transcriptional regulator
MFFGDCDPNRPGERRGRWGFEDMFDELWGGRARRGPRPRGGGRMFGQGDLKFVILRLLAEKPRHGYEIIKELEERSGGTYSPSPGTVYPTLVMLEDMGYARATPEEGGKKIYAITEEGRAHLEAHGDTVDDIFERMARVVEGFFDAPMTEIHGAFRRVGKAAYGTATRNVRDPELLGRIREILERAARDIEDAASRRAGSEGSSTAGR